MYSKSGMEDSCHSKRKTVLCSVLAALYTCLADSSDARTCSTQRYGVLVVCKYLNHRICLPPSHAVGHHFGKQHTCLPVTML